MPLTDVQANARYWLVWNALTVLSTSALAHSRKELFATFEPPPDEPIDPYIKEVAAVKWQQKTLELFIRKGIAISSPSDHEALYSRGDIDTILAILDEWADGSGLLIPSLVTGEFNFDAMLDSKLNSKKESAPTIVDSPDNQTEPSLPIEHTENNNNSKLVDTIHALSGHLQNFEDFLKAQHKLLDYLQGFEDNLNAHMGELEKKIGGVNKRLDTNDSRFIEINQKLDSALNKLKDTAELSAQIKDNSNKLSNIKDSIEALSVRSALNNLAAQLSAYVKQTSIQTDEAKMLLQTTLEKLAEVK